jgi:hypothetical protein
MTEERQPLAELLAKAGEGDFLRRVVVSTTLGISPTDFLQCYKHSHLSERGFIGASARRSLKRHGPKMMASIFSGAWRLSRTSSWRARRKRTGRRVAGKGRAVADLIWAFNPPA